MLDEEMDDIIRNAAAKHHPGYNDQAWEKMEAQLDKHLPQKKDRRKFIFFLLFFLLLGGGALFTVVKLTGNKDSGNTKIAEAKKAEQATAKSTTEVIIPVDEKTTSANGQPITVDQDSKNLQAGNSTSQQQADPANASAQNNIPRGNNSNIVNDLPGKNKRSIITKKGRANTNITAGGIFDETINDDENKTATGKTRTKKTVDKNKTSAVITGSNPEEKEMEKDQAISSAPKQEQSITELVQEQKEKPKEEKQKDEKPVEEKKKETIAARPSSPDKKKNKKNPFSNFGITVSAGPDISFVKLNNAGKTTLNYGAGLSYNFAKRFTVRAGFYVSRKIYSATPEEYKATITYPYLNMVDANCKIYEIPIGFNYDIIQKKKYNLFGGLGLSSYLMKTEDYDYIYKVPSGQTYTYKGGVKDENKHYFSVLTLSAGYQYKISKRVSIQAEPYVKLPLAGVGIGKIKLNSSGILFTATVKPFAKKN